ncbi:MAG: hypothetical protein GPJ13_16995 [Microcystis aeruginosa W11-06]|nr:hypothetical protein [Microcystis aeruginosa W11-03]NCR95369.1 hypothetical protein [Microcystis aeruginosa W11-06]
MVRSQEFIGGVIRSCLGECSLQNSDQNLLRDSHYQIGDRTILLKGNVPGFGGLAPHSAVVMTLAVNGIIRKNLSNKIV